MIVGIPHRGKHISKEIFIIHFHTIYQQSERKTAMKQIDFLPTFSFLINENIRNNYNTFHIPPGNYKRKSPGM